MGMGTTMSGARFGEPTGDVEDDEVNLLTESFYSEVGGSHPRLHSITWATTHPPLSSQPQPIEEREVVNAEDKLEGTTLNEEMHNAGLRQQSRSRGRPTRRHLFECTPLDAVPGSYVEDSTETSAPQVEGPLADPEQPRMSTSGSRASGKRSAGIVFLSVGVGTLFAFGTHMDVSKGVGERRVSAVEKEKKAGCRCRTRVPHRG